MLTEFDLSRRTTLQTHAFVVYVCGPSPEGKSFVGRTSQFSRRAYDHQRGINRAAEEAPLLQAAITRFGWDCLRPGIVAQSNIAEEANRLQLECIAMLNSRFPNGYNRPGDGMQRSASATKIPAFDSIEFTDLEIQEAGTRRLSSDSCGVCGSGTPPYCTEICDWCGVGIAFGREVLAHLVERGLQEPFSPRVTPALKKSLKSSSGVESLFALEKSRLGVRRADDVLPSIVDSYTAKLFPYIRQSLQRDLLESRGLGRYSLGRLWVLDNSPEQIKAKISSFKYLRKHKREFEAGVSSRVSVLGKTLFFYGNTEARQSAVLEAFIECKLSQNEISEAKEEAILLSEVRRHQELESQQFSPQGDAGNFPLTESNCVAAANSAAALPLDFPSSSLAGYCAGEFESHMDSWQGKPVVFLFHGSIKPYKFVLFNSLSDRRSFVRRMLSFTPQQRLKHLQDLVTDLTLGFEAREWVVPSPTNSPGHDEKR